MPIHDEQPAPAPARRDDELPDLSQKPVTDTAADDIRGGGTSTTLNNVSKSLDSQDKLGNTKIQTLMSSY